MGEKYFQEFASNFFMGEKYVQEFAPNFFMGGPHVGPPTWAPRGPTHKGPGLGPGAAAGGAACAGRILRSQPDPSPNAPRDQIRRKEPLLRQGLRILALMCEGGAHVGHKPKQKAKEHQFDLAQISSLLFGRHFVTRISTRINRCSVGDCGDCLPALLDCLSTAADNDSFNSCCKVQNMILKA